MKRLFLAIVVIVQLLLCSCWDNREINELGLVTAVGIDKGEDSKYSITVQIAGPGSGGGGSESGSAKINEWIGTADGDSLFDAVRALGDISSKRIMWAHNSVVIIGEALARDGIIPVVDFFTHNPELRMKTVVVVSKGDAKDYVSANAGLESPSGISFVQLQGYRALSAESVESDMLEVSARLKSKYANPLIAGIDLKQSTTKSQNGEMKLSESKTIRISGAAVFQRDKMIGWLMPEEALGMSWVLNQTHNTVVTVKVPEYGDKAVSVETMGVEANVKSKIVGGLPHITVDITGTGEIVEEDGSTKLDIEKAKQVLSQLISDRIKQEADAVISVVQKKYRVDVFGLAATVHTQNATEWKGGLQNKWDAIFPQIPIIVKVKIDVHGSTLNQIPMNINGSAG